VEYDWEKESRTVLPRWIHHETLYQPYDLKNEALHCTLRQARRRQQQVHDYLGLVENHAVGLS
jgi:hypothetical protein